MDIVSKKKSASRPRKSAAAFRTISEVAEELDLQQHVLRFWETKFTQICPMKRGGGRRYYRPEDIALLKRIKKLLHNDGYTIKGVQKLFSDEAVGAAANASSESVQVALEAPNFKSEIAAAIGELEDLKNFLSRATN